VVWILLGVLLLVIALALLMAVQARQANRHLKAAVADSAQLRAQVLAGDEAAVRSTVAAIGTNTAQARDALAGPQWALAAHLPWVGTNAEALQTVTEVSDDLSHMALPELTSAAEVLRPDDLKPQDGRVALEPIRKVRPYVQRSAASTATADDRLAGIHPDDLLPPLRSRFVDAAAKVAALRATMDAAARATRVLPSVLGADGPRSYLLLVQNNSEPRALGGIAGSVIELRASHGRIELLRQVSGESFGDFGKPVLKLSKGERALYGTQLGRFMQNVTGTPDFPRTTELATEMWTREHGKRVDGVASIDPAALSALLRATGPVQMKSGQRLTEANAAQVFLNDVYLDLPNNEQQDAFFGKAASAIFDHFIDSAVEILTAVDVLTEATDQGRFMFWSNHQEEQRVLAGTRVSGELERAGPPEVGVYLHDRTQSKIGWYEDMDVDVSHACSDTDPGQLTVSVSVTSNAPSDAADTLPIYVTGTGEIAPRGRIASQLYVYAPPGSKITAFRPTKGPKRADLATHDGLQAATWPLELAPGESITAEYDIESRKESLAEATVRTTPGPVDGRFSVSTSQCTS